MADKTFNCNVLTPERSVLKTEATFAAIPASDGEIGVMHDRAPLLCRLGVGILRLETPEGPKRIYVDAGFAEVNDNQLTVLTEQAAFAKDVDVEAERAAEAEARQRHAANADEQEARQRAIKRAAMKQKLAGRS
ncbi:MAG: ATP synthase F1 subunit epsilon [Phycisphaerales bacterium]|nr:ATP synthase F1 subunit epsilon [Phycisphaerales bacterium]